MDDKLLDAIKRWCDLSMDSLRTEYTYVLGVTTRSRYDDKVYTKGMSRGDMIRDMVENWTDDNA